MADDRKYSGRHNITLDRRENVSVTGVIDVISFDEETIICDTEMGALVVKGINLHVSRLSLDSGELAVDGEIESIAYEDNLVHGKSKGSLLSKIFK